ncbi:MAG: phosphatidylglycerophosphatase A [Bacteriovoracaceae bacterium]|nr:phosphatidylglycerophosphatase A [Bacteriovoracaceae bacterium]
MNRLNKLFLSFFGVGCAPIAPGTFGSAAGILVLFYIAKFDVSLLVLCLLNLTVTIAAIFAVDYYQQQTKNFDPGWIVIDEVVGIIWAWCFVPEASLVNFILVFLLFRIFDIFKPWPVSYFDHLKSGFGVVMDDVVSGLLAGLILKILYMIPFISSIKESLT